jgi:hypothetical protein
MGDTVNETDSTGFIIDTALNIISIGVSISDVKPNPRKASNWAALGADVSCTMIPGATGGGTAVRAAGKIGKSKKYQVGMYKALRVQRD